MKKPVFLLVFLLFYPQFASAYTNFSYLNLGGVRYSYLSSNEYTDYHVIPTEPVIHDEKDEDGGLKTVFSIVQEVSPAVSNYMFDDNVTKTQLYIGLTSSLLSFAIKKLTEEQFDLRLHERINSDNKSDYSVELGFRPISFIGFNFLVPNGEYMFALSVFPSKNTKFSFSISDNQTTTVTGFNINTVF